MSDNGFFKNRGVTGQDRQADEVVMKLPPSKCGH